MAARGVGQAKDVSVFYYTHLSQIKEHNFCLWLFCYDSVLIHIHPGKRSRKI